MMKNGSIRFHQTVYLSFCCCSKMGINIYIYILLITPVLISGCASTTILNTSPDNADVYISGENRGKTPYHYSDRKTSFSSTPVTFKKYGYKDLDIILRRNEVVAAEALIPGLFLYVPLLWITKYEKVHNYELEKDYSVVQPDPDFIISSDTAISKRDTVSINQDYDPLKMAVTDQMTENTDNNISPGKLPYKYPDPEKLNDNKNEKLIANFGIGGGICFPGSVFCFDLTLISSKILLGGTIRGDLNIFRSKDTPDDYFDDGARVFAPKDYINTFSVNLAKAFDPVNKNFRCRIEIGPSLVNYRKAVFEPNPDYHTSEEGSWWFSTYKYYKSHPLSSSKIGLSLSAGIDLLLKSSVRYGFSAFANLNSIKTIAGLEVKLIFGKAGNKNN